MTKTVAWSEIASAGTSASHHWRVRNRRIATAMTHVPMMISVLPIVDHQCVRPSHCLLTAARTSRLIWSSPGRSPSGPLMKKPPATIAAHSTTAGAMARTAMSRSASRTGGRV